MSSDCSSRVSLLDSPSSSLANRLELRPLVPSDLNAVISLCTESFPIQYPSSWFEEVVNGSYTSVGLFDGYRLVAMMVSELKNVGQCNLEDRDILSDPKACVVYILSLAVTTAYRRMGLATRLLQHLMEYVVHRPPYPRAVFLHVLSTNLSAIRFYKNNGFTHHDTLLNYYRLESNYGDGFTYVKYTNGSRAPVSIAAICRHLGYALCFPLKAAYKAVSFS